MEVKPPRVALVTGAATGIGRGIIGNGNRYEMSYATATFVSFRDGLIINYREYWNPLAPMEAMSGARFDGGNSGK